MSSFQFDFFDARNSQLKEPEPNLEQVMNQIDQNSFDFDQFEPVDENHKQQKSFQSNPFEQNQPDPQPSYKSRKSKPQELLDNSRNINEISIIQNKSNESFKYQKAPQPLKKPQEYNERYDRLQSMLNKAKTNNLDMFYKNLDEQQVYRNEQKFRNKDEFKMYKKELKTYKRGLEENFIQQNGNYHFKYNHYETKPVNKKKQLTNLFGLEENPFNFKKKQTQVSKERNQFDFFEQEQKPGPKNVLLFDDDFQNFNNQQDEFFDQLKPEQIDKKVEKYQEQQYYREAQNFFNSEPNVKKQQKKAKILDTINEQRANLFEVTHEQQKMNKLLNNYNELKSNFTELITNLNSTYTDKEMIVKELKKIKIESENKESRLKLHEQNKKEKLIMKEKEKSEKNKKIIEIKDQIHKIKQFSEKNVLIEKLNEKVQNLEELLKNAISELHQEKQTKVIPKIINYYVQENDHEQFNLQNRQQSQRSLKSKLGSSVGLSKESQYNEYYNGQAYQMDKLTEELYIPIKNAVKVMKEYRKQQNPQGQYFVDEYSSPFQLDLTTNDHGIQNSRNRSVMLEQPFIPSQNSHHYMPNALDYNNKYLRKALTQKSSILFQSFQFYITGKYTITNNENYPISCQIRVANKCVIDLYDLFLVVYGPEAQESQLQMRPPRIIYDVFKYNTSFLFEVDLSKSCLDKGNFNIQVSYKVDSVNKKKVNFRAVIPFIHLIKPEFIYEEQFMNAWNHMGNEYYIAPKLLDFKNIRSHEDLKLILPFIEINENDANSFSYGIMFTFPKSSSVFMLKVTCYINGKASVHLRTNQTNQNIDKKLRQQILDIINYLVYG